MRREWLRDFEDQGPRFEVVCWAIMCHSVPAPLGKCVLQAALRWWHNGNKESERCTAVTQDGKATTLTRERDKAAEKKGKSAAAGTQRWRQLGNNVGTVGISREFGGLLWISYYIELLVYWIKVYFISYFVFLKNLFLPLPPFLSLFPHPQLLSSICLPCPPLLLTVNYS